MNTDYRRSFVITRCLPQEAGEGIRWSTALAEAVLTYGLPSFELAGYAAAVERETRDRIRAAILTSGFAWPLQPIVITIINAGLRTRPYDPGHDLPIAAAILYGTEQLPEPDTQIVLYGELGLDGTVHPSPNQTRHNEPLNGPGNLRDLRAWTEAL
jgi:Subunit ChlI of Mg-chelatase